MRSNHHISKLRRAVPIATLAAAMIVAGSPAARAQNATDRTIDRLQLHLKMYPNDFKSYDALGAAYIQKGRETGDASYSELAKSALEKSLDLDSNDPAAASAKTNMAVVAMSEHRFEDAIQWANDALALGSGDAAPWALIGDALTDMGDYDQAEGAYAKLRSREPGDAGPSELQYEHNSRVAYLKFIRGDSKEAVALMRGAVAEAQALGLPAENLAWSDYQLGEILMKSGDLAGAEQAYSAGLGADAHSYRNLAGLAEVRASQERYAEAAILYKQAIAVVPYPAFAAALYDLEMKLDQPQEAQKQYKLIEFIAKLDPVNERLFYRELALFYADHGLKMSESLPLAKRELDVRRDVYTWDIVAWAQYKNGHTREAADAIAKALAVGTEDPLLDFHAGVIESALGHNDRARTLLGRALALNPHFHVLYADQAQQLLARLETASPASTEGLSSAVSISEGGRP